MDSMIEAFNRKMDSGRRFINEAVNAYKAGRYGEEIKAVTGNEEPMQEEPIHMEASANSNKTVKCLKCGENNASKAKFCMYCGEKMEAPKKLFCPECGTPLSAEARFCINCGRRSEN